MEELQKILADLEKKLNQVNAQNVENVPSTHEEQQSSVQQTSSISTDDQLQYFKGVGIQLFLARNSSLPNIHKLFPFIENYAHQLLVKDLNNGSIKESYDMYLEEAKNYVLKEIVNTAKDFASYSQTKQEMPSQPSQPSISYTMQDFMNDYKKSLEYITLKDNTLIFADGVATDKGVKTIGEGKAELHSRPKLEF